MFTKTGAGLIFITLLVATCSWYVSCALHSGDTAGHTCLLLQSGAPAMSPPLSEDSSPAPLGSFGWPLSHFAVTKEINVVTKICKSVEHSYPDKVQHYDTIC